MTALALSLFGGTERLCLNGLYEAACGPGVTVALHVLEGAGMIRSTGGAFAFSIGTSEELAGGGYGQPEAEYRKLVGPFGKDGPSSAAPD